MCGIAGYVTKNPKEKANIPSGEILKAMMERIRHRGPDGSGVFSDNRCALGHVRLAILDLNTGDQPIFNEEKNLVTVFNGEIYNYKELGKELKAKGHVFLTDSDTEILVHGFEEWGKDLPRKLRGMYAFAIWNRDTEELFLARDKWGIKPLYYYENEKVFLFASEIKAFLDHPDFVKEFNEEILAAYLCFNSTPTEETFFKGVYRLEPGCSLYLNKGEKSVEEFFFPDIEEPASECISTEQIHAAVSDSVCIHMNADVEIGSFLSSGIDSSYLVSLAKPLKTYTAGYADAACDEISYAADLAEKLGIKNTSRVISKKEYLEAFPKIMYFMDEPLADPSAVSLNFVAETAAKDVKVVLSGEGADEFFGGYLSYLQDLDQNPYLKIPYFLRHLDSEICYRLPEKRGRNYRYRAGQKLENYWIGLGRVFRDNDAKKIIKLKNQIPTKDITAKLYERLKGKSDTVKRQTIDFYFWLVRDFLHAVDRNCMMFGLEARTPFLDDEVYNAARYLTRNQKISRETTKPALREAAKKVIPNESYKKKKLGFPVPLREWMREEDFYTEIKLRFESETASRFFHQDAIIKLLEEHREGRADHYKKVWAVYTFLVWYDCYFE